MRRSIAFPIVGAAVALAVLWFIFFASRPEEAVLEGDVVEEVADDPGMLGVVEEGEEED